MRGEGVSNGGGRPAKPPLPHFKDLFYITPSIDESAPLDRLLKFGEDCFTNYELYRSAGRPADATREYMKAVVVMAEFIPMNKDSKAVAAKTPVGDRWRAIKLKISKYQPEVIKFKEAIEEDNRISGVQAVGPPKSPLGVSLVAKYATIFFSKKEPHESANGSENGPANGAAKGYVNGMSNGSSQPPGNALVNGGAHISGSGQNSNASLGSAYINSHPPRGQKPSAPPKPQTLQGNATTNSISSSKSPHDALAERFNKLRSSSRPLDAPLTSKQTAAPAQAPLKPRATPAEVANISLISDLPDLPKVPEAIYSPARGTVSQEAASLPSSNSRGMFTRTPSSASQVRSPPLSDDYFAPLQNPLPRNSMVQSPLPPPAQPPPPRPSVNIPDSDTVTAMQLHEYQKMPGFEVLVIDVRSREDFDEGHIRAQFIVCVEPEVLQRENISADAIEEALCLAPPEEMRLFAKRNEFDLKVFYDQDSEEINFNGGTPQADVLLGLHNAIKHYDFYSTDESPKPLRLLKGGLEAWIDLMGPASLVTSSTALAAQRIVKPSLARGPPRPIQIQDAAVAAHFEESAQREHRENIIRDKDEFLRQPLTVQESMTSPTVERRPPPAPPQRTPPPLPPPRGQQSQRGEYPVPSDLENQLSMAPRRPAPAVPRPSHSGLQGPMDSNQSSVGAGTKSAAAKRARSRPVGLRNPGPWCYANSVLQALFHSYGFAAELNGPAWEERWVVPKRSQELIKNPQLLMKMMSNLFFWMVNGQFEIMQAKTLMEYINHLHSNDTSLKKSEAFGSTTDQQDAAELFRFLITQLDDETNRREDLTTKEVSYSDKKNNFRQAQEYWGEHTRCHDSIADKYFRGLKQTAITCLDCGQTSCTHEAWTEIHLSLPADAPRGSLHLKDLVHEEFPRRGEAINYNCGGCKKKEVHANKKDSFARMPELLYISLGRYYSPSSKNDTRVDFPINDLDLSEFIIDGGVPADANEEWKRPFRYYCCSVITHRGTLSQGHYIAYVRDEGRPEAAGGGSAGADEDWMPGGGHGWHRCDDEKVTPLKIDDEDAAEKEGMYGKDGFTSYVLCYKRKTNPGVSSAEKRVSAP